MKPANVKECGGLQSSVQAFSHKLQFYLPVGTSDKVAELMASYYVKLTITNPRSSKKGDYRPPIPGKRNFHKISINRDLNPYAFLVTLLHELAHLQTHELYNIKNVKPHGSEWKACFRSLLTPFLEDDCFPEPVKQALEQYLQNPSAATCSSPALTRALRAYDHHQSEVFLSEIPFHDYFYWRGKRLFQRLKKQRTRYDALELKTGRYYRIHQHALVMRYR